MEIIAFFSLLAAIVTFPVEDVLPTVGGRTICFVAGALAVGLWLIVAASRSRRGLRVDRASAGWGVAILAWGIISAVWAEYAGDVFTRAVVFTNMLLFFVVSQDLVSQERRLRWLMDAFVAACSLYSVWGLANYVLLGFNRLAINDIQNPNRLANNFALALIISGLPRQRPLLQRLFLAVGQVALVVGIVLSGSRGALVSLPLAVLGALALGKIGMRVKRKYMLMLLGAGLIGYTLLSWDLVPVSDNVRDRILNISALQSNEGGGRFGLFAVGVAMWKDYPFFGVGWDNFPYRMGSYISQTTFWRNFQHSVKETVAAHNTYLSAACELGAIGLGLLLLFLLALYRRLWAARDTHLGIMGMAIFLYICLAALKSDLLSEKVFWTGMALSAVSARLAHATD